jgi:hypothetical protein
MTEKKKNINKRNNEKYFQTDIQLIKYNQVAGQLI